MAAITGTLSGIANPSFSYDANGNLTAGAGRTLAWTSFDLPASITQGATSASFLYGPEHQRVKQSAAGTTTIYLFDPHYEKETTSAGTEHKHYLYAGSQLIGLHTQRSNGTNDTRYVHTDHLGSVSVVTNEAGAVVERLAYDAWGKRRQPSGADDPNNTIRPAVDRGYTGHEQLDAGGMGLVHMNGRLYDPQLARVLSPDPIIQAPGFSQSYNRYSYVINNPLRYLDPNGMTYVSVPSGVALPGQFERVDADGVLAMRYPHFDPEWDRVGGTLYAPGTWAWEDDPAPSASARRVPSFSNVMSGYGGGATIYNQGTNYGGSPVATQSSTNTTTNTANGFSSSTTVTFTNTSGGNGCTTSCSIGTPAAGTATGGSSQGVSSGAGIMGAAGSGVGSSSLMQTASGDSVFSGLGATTLDPGVLGLMSGLGSKCDGLFCRFGTGSYAIEGYAVLGGGVAVYLHEGEVTGVAFRFGLGKGIQGTYDPNAVRPGAGNVTLPAGGDSSIGVYGRLEGGWGPFNLGVQGNAGVTTTIHSGRAGVVPMQFYRDGGPSWNFGTSGDVLRYGGAGAVGVETTLH